MELVEGGVSRRQYCGTLWRLLTGGGYQGDILWGYQVFAYHCVNR
jgi:hypothetical protein